MGVETENFLSLHYFKYLYVAINRSLRIKKVFFTFVPLEAIPA